MKLLRVTTNYPLYLEQFYGARPELQRAAFDVQYREIMLDSFGWADFWSHALAPLGYEVWEPVANALFLQRAWATENGVAFDERRFDHEVILAQARAFQPDVVLANDHRRFDVSFFEQLKQQCPSIRLVIGWCGAPPIDGPVFAAYDLILSNIPGFVDDFRRRGHDAEYFRHAFSKEVLKRIDVDGPGDGGFCFAGSLIRGEGFHADRYRLLSELVEQTDLELFIPGRKGDVAQPENDGVKGSLRNAIYRTSHVPGLKWLVNAVPRARQIAEAGEERRYEAQLDARCHPPLFGRTMYEKLAQSAVTLNSHIDATGPAASNMRLFEATGVGACLLTDWKPNLVEFFEPEREVVTYRSPAEAVEKYRWLQAHERERREIAAAGQQRTLREHTFDHRAPILHEMIQSRI